jgi:2-deoxy-D-gluconate 3-dehydrogenase
MYGITHGTQRDPSNTSTKLAIESLGRKATIYTADLGNQAEVSSVAPKILADGHDVSILVTCAGIQRRHPSHEFPLRDWDEVLQVNLTSVFTLCRDFGAYMLTRTASPASPASPASVAGVTGGVTGGAGDSSSSRSSSSTADAIDSSSPHPQSQSQPKPKPHPRHQPHRGSIINVASLVSFQGGLTVPAYASAKGGIAQLTKALSNEWAGHGINVNAIAPGYVRTDMNEALINNETRARQILERIPAGRWGEPEDFKGPVVWLASRASGYVSGEIVVVDGGWMGR